MNLRDRQFTLVDYILIPFQVNPLLSALSMINKLITAVLPAILVFVTADFVNTSSSIFRQEAPRQQIIRSIILILLIVAYQNIGGAIKELLKVRITQKIDEYIQFSITEKRAHLEYRHIENNETWEIIKRVAQAPAERMWDGFDSLLSLCEVFIKIFSILLVLVGQIWQVGLVIIISLIPLFSRSLKAGKNTYAAFVETTKYQRRAEYLHTVLTDRESVEERALFGYTAAIQKQWFEKYETARLITLKVKMKNYIRMKTASLITIFYSALTAAALTPSLAEGTVTLGMFTGLVSAMFSQVHSMSWTFAGILNRLADNREYLKDLTAFSKLSETDKMTAPRVIAEGPPFQTLIMRDVTFRYPGTERYIFKNCNLKIEKGKHYAFVGINGAGKTTIAKLFSLLYDDYEGEIIINGKELREYDYSEIKGFFSYVFQDFAKYYISMRDNIAIGSSFTVEETALRSVLSRMDMIDFAERLPEGIDTNLGKIRPNGVNISGGEWQRIAISRALCSDAPILILDEPTAALDPISESNIYSLFTSISKEKTTIVITHRLGAARMADKIFVINNGCVEESDSHAELMAAGGLYAEMFESQRSWYNEQG